MSNYRIVPFFVNYSFINSVSNSLEEIKRQKLDSCWSTNRFLFFFFEEFYEKCLSLYWNLVSVGTLAHLGTVWDVRPHLDDTHETTWVFESGKSYQFNLIAVVRLKRSNLGCFPILVSSMTSSISSSRGSMKWQETVEWTWDGDRKKSRWIRTQWIAGTTGWNQQCARAL